MTLKLGWEGWGWGFPDPHIRTDPEIIRGNLAAVLDCEMVKSCVSLYMFWDPKTCCYKKGVEFFTNLFIQYDWHIKFTFTQICLMSIFWDAGSQGDTHRFKNSSAAYSAPLFGDFGGFMCVFVWRCRKDRKVKFSQPKDTNPTSDFGVRSRVLRWCFGICGGLERLPWKFWLASFLLPDWIKNMHRNYVTRQTCQLLETSIWQRKAWQQKTVERNVTEGMSTCCAFPGSRWFMWGFKVQVPQNLTKTF